MYKRIFILLLISFFTVFLAVACSNQDAENNAQNNDKESSQTKETEEAENSKSDQDDESDSDNEQNSNDAANDDKGTTVSEESNQSNESESDNDKDLPDTIEINDKTQTDTGVIFELEKISFEDDHIAVYFNAENQSGFKKTLANQGEAQNDNLGGITLQDDTGFDYRYVAEIGESRIEVKDQEKVDGIVRFAGKIQNDAETLTLKFNPDEESTDSMPKFSYEDIEIEW